MLASREKFLLVRDNYETPRDDVSMLKGSVKNASTTFEARVNKAILFDAALEERYGPLSPAAAGEVVFYKRAAADGSGHARQGKRSRGDAYVSVDGIFLGFERATGARVAVFNEAKQHVAAADVTLVTAAREKLRDVLAAPASFESVPAGVVDVLEGCTLVPLLSCVNANATTAAACAAARVHVLERTAEGFVCTLAKG